MYEVGILAVLLALRYPLLYISAALNFPLALTVVYVYATYLLSALLFCLLIKSRETYHFSFPSLTLFALSPFLSLLIDSDYSQLPKVVFSIALCTFAIWYYLKGKGNRSAWGVNTASILNLVFAILVGVGVGCLSWIISGSPKSDNSMNPVTVQSTISLLLFQLSFAATSEEPLFRGFLWGFLSKKVKSQFLVGVIIAILFWIAHLYYIGQPLVFWVLQPIGAITLSLVLYKTKNIGYTMIVHCLLNVVPEILRFL